jgi:hypothetical protein
LKGQVNPVRFLIISVIILHPASRRIFVCRELPLQFWIMQTELDSSIPLEETNYSLSHTLLKWMSLLQWAVTLAIFVSGTWWWRVTWWKGIQTFRLPDLYFAHFGFAVFVPLGLLAWGLTGFRGLGTLVGHKEMIWAMLLLQLAAWTRIGYGDDVLNSTVALWNATMWITLAVFVLSVLSNPPPLRWVIGALIAGMVIQVTLGIAQVAVQHDIGIFRINEALGLNTGIRELPLDPLRSGVSVVNAEGVRFLRPYGLGGHPNLMVPAVIVGICAGWASWQKPESRRWAAVILTLGWWGLLLSFSRAAVGGAVLGLGVMGVVYRFASPPTPPSDNVNVVPTSSSLAPLRWEKGWSEVKPYLPPVLLILLVSAIFVGFYAPLMGVRFGVEKSGQATLEDYSAASRAVYQEQAISLIKRYPWTGVGIGNMAWHSAAMLQFDPRDLRGQPVHNIYLLAWSEVGLIGFVLFLGVVGCGLAFTLWRAWHGGLHPYQIGLLGGVIGLLAVGWFDHYLWTQYGHLLIFWGIFAVMLSPVEREN